MVSAVSAQRYRRPYHPDPGELTPTVGNKVLHPTVTAATTVPGTPTTVPGTPTTVPGTPTTGTVQL